MCAPRNEMNATVNNMTPACYADGEGRRPHTDKRRVSAVTRYFIYYALVAPFLGEYISLTVDNIVGTICGCTGVVCVVVAPWCSRKLSLQSRILWSVFSGPIYLAYIVVVIGAMYYIVDPTYHIPWRA